jgi:uncharacterized protein (TIGR02646 family)
MLNISKARELPELINFKQNYPNSTGWNDIKKVSGLKRKLREYLLEHEQKVNGSYCCVYCERKITVEESHIEHIKPKSQYRSDTFNYVNLTVSCEEEEVTVNDITRNLRICGHHKGNRFDEDNFINPVRDNPEDFFTYDETAGEIVPLETLSAEKLGKVEYTINLLNLNDEYLKDTRMGILDELFSIDAREELMHVIDNFDQFPGLVNFFKSELLDIWEEMQ